MTEGQERLYRYLLGRCHDLVQPSFSEMEAAVGGGRSSIHRMLILLGRAGLIEKLPGHTRCWRAIADDRFPGHTAEQLAAELRRRGWTVERPKGIPGMKTRTEKGPSRQ